jgi:hypothetical protein
LYAAIGVIVGMNPQHQHSGELVIRRNRLQPCGGVSVIDRDASEYWFVR